MRDVNRYSNLMRKIIQYKKDTSTRSRIINPSLKYNAFESLDLFIGYMRSYIFEKAEYYASEFEYFEQYGFLYASLSWYF